MRVYTTCPSKGPAKTAWTHFFKKNDEHPKAIWKMPNNFQSSYSIESGGWGLWIADYGDWKDYYDPTKPTAQTVRNVYSFIKKQSVITNTIKSLLRRKNGKG